MYALVDAVAFYASAEKVFDPAIRNKPVVVLTNNDGCVCAVCPIARRLGIPKFQPFFKVKHVLEKHQVVIRSSNYELYADLSERMMNTLARFCDKQHIYSIDEAFLDFNGFATLISDWSNFGQFIRRTVWRETKLPVGVGFGPTATLAKAANHAAKKLAGFNGVAVISDEQSRKQVLAAMAVGDIWGVGRRLANKLKLINIHSGLDLAEQSPQRIKRLFSVVLARTVKELNGIPCLSWDDVRQDKKQLFSTRSFGQRITDRQALKTALINHACVVARKLREQKSLAQRLVIFVASSPHQQGYYKKSYSYQFSAPTADSITLTNAVTDIFAQLYKPGVAFYKCGVGALELSSQVFQQRDLFANEHRDPKLMSCLDTINARYGIGTLAIASATQTQRWHMKRQYLSPHYTTRWHDLPKIQC
ncbi:Y-family DNA polymerase [Pseudoalteromonas mariniglutinosa]|uniref:Y-family DNA polymerase n=1 Tax=Pseudoalteromonas mariniglutinosa TaxID=206042 RepID=UPI00384CD2C7